MASSPKSRGESLKEYSQLVVNRRVAYEPLSPGLWHSVIELVFPGSNIHSEMTECQSALNGGSVEVRLAYMAVYT